MNKFEKFSEEEKSNKKGSGFMTKAFISMSLVSAIIGCGNANNKPNQNNSELLSAITSEVSAKDSTGDKNSKNLYILSTETAEDTTLNFTVTADDLKDGPFDVKNPAKRMIPLTYGNLLGESQARLILKLNDKNGLTKDNKLTQKDTLNIPLIYPELKSEFSENWEDLKNNENFKFLQKYRNNSSQNKILVTKCSNGKHALAYYKNGILKMATYVSIGTLKAKTITGEYSVGYKDIRKKSKTYDNAPMPYAIHIYEGYFMHQGASNGTPRSHGCIRLPGLYERWLFYEMKGTTKDNTSIILDNLY